MRPQVIPPLVFGDLQAWLRDNSNNIGRRKIHMMDDTPNETKHSSTCFVQPQENVETKTNAPAPNASQELQVVKKTEATVTPPVSMVHKKRKSAPKPPVGQSVVTLCKPAATMQQPESRNGTFTDFTWWQNLRKNAELRTTPLPPNTSASTYGKATFRGCVIDRLTRIYSLKVLPGGEAVGEGAILKKLHGREMARMPAFLPSTRSLFGKQDEERNATHDQFRRLWFRVTFVDKEQYGNKIVHFKDLASENDKHVLKPLMHALFAHLANGNQDVQRVFAFAIDAELSFWNT